jgi:hypothetical protein
MLFSLSVDSGVPFLHRFLVRKPDDKILNSRVAFPEDLNRVGTYKWSINWAKAE